jgi:hypothetical protein
VLADDLQGTGVSQLAHNHVPNGPQVNPVLSNIGATLPPDAEGGSMGALSPGGPSSCLPDHAHAKPHASENH